MAEWWTNTKSEVVKLMLRKKNCKSPEADAVLTLQIIHLAPYQLIISA